MAESYKSVKDFLQTDGLGVAILLGYQMDITREGVMDAPRIPVHGPFDHLTEGDIRRDIEGLKGKLQELGVPVSRRQVLRARVLLKLPSHRRRLLQAFRDGRPERWVEYPE